MIVRASKGVFLRIINPKNYVQADTFNNLD